jgi:microsomal dipeptidase-like Zn-dependent dipeptidase
MQKRWIVKQTTVASILLAIATGGAAAQSPVWGFADLHTHPASHLAFGADPSGANGLFWGKPGLDLASSSTDSALASDLPACEPDTHTGFTLDAVQHATRQQMIQALDQQTGWIHYSNGYPNFSSWPNALSLSHQQMHISAIKRAYDGGLRLLFAAATDNEVLSDLWHIGFNANGNPIPVPDSSFDFNSAVRQLTFIKSLVAANSSWMQIVTTSSEARQATQSNKLAVVLSVEMDSLSPQQILTLATNYQVRHVTPVHLANSAFGGVAVYDDLWNGNNNFLNGHFYDVQSDKCLSFQLGEPQVLMQDRSVPFTGAIILGTNSDTDAAAVTYGQIAPGHENRQVLNQGGFEQLMRAGLLLDIAHMGKVTADGALKVAQLYQYPLMDSHTSLRDDGDGSCENGPPAGNETPVTERALPYSQVKIIRDLGGVIGLGTTGIFGDQVYPDAVEKWLKDYQVALQLMGGKGVALGTDMNGLSPQILINQYGYATTYPVTIASRVNPPPGVLTPPLPQFRLGSRTYDFTQDGLANYGLLPDFLQAVSEHPDYDATPPACTSAACQQCLANICGPALNGCVGAAGPRHSKYICNQGHNTCAQFCEQSNSGSQGTSAQPPNPAAMPALVALYHTAEDTIEMWEKVEAAAARMANTCDPGLTMCSGSCVNVANNFANCGACGRSCAASQTCQNNTCVAQHTTCGPGLTSCCGGCYRSCPAHCPSPPLSGENP